MVIVTIHHSLILSSAALIPIPPYYPPHHTPSPYTHPPSLSPSSHLPVPIPISSSPLTIPLSLGSNYRVGHLKLFWSISLPWVLPYMGYRGMCGPKGYCF